MRFHQNKQKEKHQTTRERTSFQANNIENKPHVLFYTPHTKINSRPGDLGR